MQININRVVSYDHTQRIFGVGPYEARKDNDNIYIKDAGKEYAVPLTAFENWCSPDNKGTKGPIATVISEDSPNAAKSGKTEAPADTAKAKS